MAKVIFTSHLDGLAPEGEPEFPGRTVGEALEACFTAHAGLRHYILDDQGRLRKHVIVFLDNINLDHGIALSAPVAGTSEIYVMQALSGG